MADKVECRNVSLKFNVDKRNCDLTFDEHALVWKECEKKTPKSGNLKYEYIVSIRQKKTKDGLISVAINYVTKHSLKWTQKKIQFISSSSSDCETLMTQVRESLNNMSNRPKSLLVFVNPDGGAKKGLKTFTRTVEPLFKLAGITTDLVVTKDENHACEVLETYDLSTVDGLVSVGGDGTFRQVIHGLMTRVARDQGKDINNPETEWSSPKQTIGIIPCGTGQGVIMALTGTKSITTATLHIILGTKGDYNLFSVFNGGKLLSVGGLLAGYGLFGEIIQYTETHRSMGRARYAVAATKMFFSGPSVFEGEIKYIPTKRNSDLTEENSSDPLSSDSVATTSGSWITERGRYIGVNMFSAPMPFIRLRKEPSMSLHWLPHDFTRGKLLKFAAQASRDKSDGFKVVDVTEVPCSVIRITRIGEGTSDIFNIDGDPYRLTDKAIEIRLLPKILKTYGDQAVLDARREKCQSEVKNLTVRL